MSDKLENIARALVAPGKGILAADESTSTIKKRFDTIRLTSTEDSRRDYREMLFRATEGMKNYVSGVILYDETIRQKAKDGTPLVDIVKTVDSLPGIKVDMGVRPLPGPTSKIETITEGLDGLRERFVDYYKLGARFAKWRAVITIADGLPTWNCVKANAHALARYTALAQEAKIVPIIEPEVPMDGVHSSHDINECYRVTEWTLHTVFRELYNARINLEGIVLKPNMIIAGQKCPKKTSAAEVAEKTIKCLKATVPSAVPGIAFLSGGQSDEAATEHLSLMNAAGPLPWSLTFSYGRALQAAAIQAWGGKLENVTAGQLAFIHRAKMNSIAALGKWNRTLEEAA